MPRRRLIRTQIVSKPSEESVEPTVDGEGSSTPNAKELQPSEDSTASVTAPSEPVTVSAEHVPQQSTLRRSRRTAPDASPPVEENSGNSDAVKCQEVLNTGTETVLKTPVIRLTRVSRRNVSPQKTNVDVTPEEDEKNGETPSAEVKEAVRGRRGRTGLRTQSPCKAVQKSENNDTESTLGSAKADTAQVETPTGDSTKNLEEAETLKVVKGTEDQNPKGIKSPRIIKRRNLWKTPKPEKELEELEENEPVFQAENVTDLEKKDVEPKKELKVSTCLDGGEESGKGRYGTHALEAVKERAAEVKIKESLAEVQVVESAAGVKVEVSDSEVKNEVRKNVGEEKIECDVQDKESCSTDKLINETAVKKEMDGEAPFQDMEKVSDAPTKTTRGRRILKRAADKENENVPEKKVLVKDCEETQPQSTEIVKTTPPRTVRQRKGMKEISDKKALQTPEHKGSVKMETELQSTEKIEADNVQAQEVEVSGNGEKGKVGTIKKDVKEIQKVQSGDILEKVEADDKIETLPTEKSKASVYTVPKGKEEIVEISKENETEEIGESSKVNIVKVNTIQKTATEEVVAIGTVDVSKKSGRGVVGRLSKISTVKVEAIKEPATEEVAVEVTVDVPKKIGRRLLGRSSKLNPVKVDTIKEPATGEVAGNQTEVHSCDIDEKMEVDDVMDPLHKEKLEDCVTKTLEDKKEIPNAADKTLEDKKKIPNTEDKEVLEETFETEEINFEDFIEVDGVDNFDEMDNADDVPGEEKKHGSTNDDEELDYEDAEDNVEDDVSSLDADELLIIEDDAEYRSLFDEEITAAEEARTQNKQAKGKDIEKKRSLHGGKPDEKGKKDDASKGSQDNRRKKDNDSSRRKSPEPRDRSRTTRSRRKSPETKDRKSPESRSRKVSPESRSRKSSPESKNRRRSPESRDKRRNPDSKGRKKSPEPRDKRKSPEACEKSKRKIEDQDKKKDSQCRNDRRRSKTPSKDDSEKDPATGCKLRINLKSDVKKSNTFRQVVVLANSIYKIQLKGMENSHVKVVYEDNLSSETVIYNIQKHRKEFGRNTLWILLSGVYTFVDDEKAKTCKNCKEPLRLMKVNYNPMLDYLLQLCRVTCDTVQYRLGSEGLITIVPPLPSLLALADNYNTHKKLHDAADGYNLIATKTSYEKMRKKYNGFCRAWTEKACERNKSWINVEAFQEYINRGEANLFPMFSKDRYEIRLKNWFEAMEKFVNLVLETPFPGMRVIESLSTTRNMDSTKEPPPPGEPEIDDKFNKVVVVGNTSFTKDLQELTKDLNIAHLNENIDFDEDGLNFLNELQNKHPSKTLWVVLSGVSEVAEPLDSGPPKCKILNCKAPIPVFVTKNDKLGDPDFKDMEIDRMVNIIVKEAFDFATLAIKKLKEGSGIFLAPIMPLCAIWSGHATSHSHDALHRMYKRDPNVPHFIGGSSVWIKSAKALEMKWLNKIVGSFKRDSYPCELMKQYKQEKPPVLEYVEDVTVSQVKGVQKAWSKMMAKMIRYYLVGSETEAVLEPVVNPVPVEAPVTLHSQGADFGPPGVGSTEAALLMKPQTQVNGVTPGVIAETFPHCAAPVGYSEMMMSPQFPAQPLPVVVAAAPQPVTPFQGAIAYPGPAQQGIPFQGFPGVQSHDPYFAGWTGPVNPNMAAASVPAFVPSVSVAPVSEASPAVAGSCTIQAPPKLKTAMKGHLVIQNLETDMNESQARTLLQEFGELGEMKWPLNQKDQPARFLMINYKQRKHAERAERILNYLKVFGDNSVVKLIGGDRKEDANKLESEDLELLLNIHDVLNRIKKESKMNKVQQVPLYPQSSHSTVEPVMADSVAPLQVPVTPVLTIVVSNFTDIVPVKDVNEMFVELGACGQGVLIQNALHFTFKGDSAVVNLLSGYRFPDKKMEVIVKSSTNEIKPTNKAVKEAKAKIEGPLSKLMKKIGGVLKEEVDDEMNVYTFKTRLCRYADGCKAKDLCPKFHDAGDRRRCLVLHRYSDEMCTVLEESGSCEAKDKCSNAHSPLEILFHFKNFRSSICPGWQQNRACDKVGRVCSYVHPGKPEMLYNDKWDNIYVEGLKRTLAYLTEAVKNLFLVKDLQCLRVLLVTVSPELAKLYVDCITELAKCCNQKVSYTAGDTVEEGTTVLITTLDALRRLVNVNKSQQSKKLDTTRLRALILDDGPALLQNCPKFIQNYFSDLSRKDVNVVITANKILNKEVEDAEVKIHPRGGFKKIFVESLKKKDSKSRSSAKAGSYRGDVLERVIASTRSSDTKPVPKKTSESQSSKDKTDKALENKSSTKDKTSTSWSSSRGSISRSSSSKDSSSSSQKLEERVKTLAALEIEYKKALDEMDKEQERELELYISSPEFHPEYEQKYSIFMEQYKVQYPERSDMEHSNNLWEEFWKELITLLLQEEYDAKKQDLEKGYKDKKEKACKGTPSQDSRDKENKQDEAKQERKSIESQKRKSSTDNRDNHKEKYRRGERSSDVGRGRMNQNRNEDGLRGRTNQRNRNGDSDKGRRQQYNKSEEFSRDSFGTGHQHHGQEEKSSRYGGMQQNSNKEEFNKGRMQQSSVPVGNKESSTDMREAINLLQELCPSLGVLGPAAQLLMRKISVCWSDRQELRNLVQNEDNKMILMRLSEKALGVSQMYGSGPQAMKLRLASSHALKLLNLASLPVENPKFYGLNIEDLAKMTYNMDPAYIVQCIKSALIAQGIYNASEKEVTDIYVAVTSAHFGIAYSKSGEAAQPKIQESRQGDSKLLKRGRPGWNEDDTGSRPKRAGASWLGRDLGVNSSNVTQGRETGGRNEYGGYGSDKHFGRSDLNLWNAKNNDTVNSSQKGSFGHQKAQDFGQQQVTDYGHKSTNSFSVGMNINNDSSSNMEFSRLGNFSSLSSNFNSGAQVRNISGGSGISAGSSFSNNFNSDAQLRNMSGGSGMSAGFNQRGKQIGENFNTRRTRMGSRFNQREEKPMQGNSSRQQGNKDEVSMMEFLSQW